ncbi:S8 family serine peptidase [Aquabacterium sp.]|uniref:S8 family serine peptidase n=1 Tax=Aquabacterium sp. TaxID=1872578 RepID=UPI002BFDBC42|nr:S8 family serine peptidase [Aquabacterium sp.]HSW05121.1 S8 family serine peptidase [Aquabacterium sp.]
MHIFGQQQAKPLSNTLGSGRRPRRFTAAAAAALLASCGSLLGAGAAHAQAEAQDWAKGRLLVMQRAGLSDAEMDKIVKVHGAKARRVGKSDLHIVDLPPQASETAVLNLLAHHPHLKFAELDRRVMPAAAPNDPYFGSEWHLAKIGAATAWDGSQGSGVTIAVLDTGVYGAHADLAANMVAGWNVFNNNADTADFYGHGTPVAGTAAAITNNGAGVAGVAGKAKIMPLVVTDSTGGSFYSVISQAITYAADRGVRVASISFSGLPYSSAVQSAAQYMKNKGGLVVVAAGNTGAVDNVAATTTMIPVASTESNDTRTTSSTYGAFVAVSAPGSNIYSTSRSGGYGVYGGTSFATPVVSGTIALMMAANPQLSSTQIESLLYSTAVDLGTAGRDVYFGHGRINAAAAVQAALAAVPSSTTDTTSPQAAISAPLGSATVSGLVPVNVGASDNVGVAKVELRANGTLVATDTSSPYAFSWDSTKVANGTANLVATAYDAAGNAGASATVAVNVANVVVADTTPPTLTILSPTLSTLASGNITVSSSASDNAGASGITQTLYINGSLTTTASGSSLSYKWNTRPLKAGTYTLKFVARDAAGNSTTVSKQVLK